MKPLLEDAPDFVFAGGAGGATAARVLSPAGHPKPEPIHLLEVLP